MALEKGTEEWEFWSDFFQFCKRNWEVKNDEQYWQSLIDQSELLYKKYNSLIAKYFIAAFLKVKSKEYQEMNE